MSEPRRTARVIVAASFAFALVQLDVTIVNVALPRMAGSLGTGLSGLQWVVDAYALGFAVLLLTGGLLADRYGAERVFRAGLWAFGATSLACGIAPGVGWLVAARALQGIAAAAMLPSSLSVLNVATAGDPRARARAVGIWTAAGGITIAAGPIVGGLLLATGSWRSIFLVNLPLCLLAAALTPRGQAGARAAPRGFDAGGQLLAIIALASLTGSVIELRPLGARHPLVILGFVLALSAGVGFVLVERRTRSPMLPMSLFRAANIGPAVLYGVAVNLTYYGVLFVLTLYLQRVKGYTPLESGLAYLPLTATFFGINIVSGWLVGRVGSRWPMALGALFDACGFALLLTLSAQSSYGQMIPAFAVIPLGMGLGVPAMTTAVLSSVDRSSSGVAMGALNAARQSAGAIGVGLFGALAGDDPGGIVGGLHTAAAFAVGLLLVAAVVAFATVRDGRELSASRTRP